VKIIFYGRLAEAIGPELELDQGARCSLAEIRERIVAEHPAAASAIASGRAFACIGGSMVRDDFVVCATDDVEFLPPVSGG
jgi:molybdopterin converting factor small subunit